MIAIGLVYSGLKKNNLNNSEENIKYLARQLNLLCSIVVYLEVSVNDFLISFLQAQLLWETQYFHTMQQGFGRWNTHGHSLV